MTDPRLDPDLAVALSAMKGDLLIVLVDRLGGDVTIPAAEIDAVGGVGMTMELDPVTREFRFTTVRK